MSNKKKILIQLDTDPKPSVFDAVVAIDAGVDHLLQYSNVKPEEVRDLIHGAMYTRGPGDLKHTAIFVGGSNVTHGETIAAIAKETLFDPFRVSIMLDSSGANSTAAAAVLSASRHVPIADSTSLVMAATGPVGQRVCKILASAKGKVFVASRDLDRSRESILQIVQAGIDETRLIPLNSNDRDALMFAIEQSDMVYGCGAAGVRLLNHEHLRRSKKLKVAIDLNAVPPSGIEGIELTDKGVERDGRYDYGALGVGGLKMKIHKASIATLFESNHRFLDCQDMLSIGEHFISR